MHQLPEKAVHTAFKDSYTRKAKQGEKKLGDPFDLFRQDNKNRRPLILDLKIALNAEVRRDGDRLMGGVKAD